VRRRSGDRRQADKVLHDSFGWLREDVEYVPFLPNMLGPNRPILRDIDDYRFSNAGEGRLRRGGRQLRAGSPGQVLV